MVSDDEQLLQETYRLVKDNNRMLHAMRRNAFLGGILKIVIYGAFVIIPLWFFVKYVGPVLNSAVGTLNQVQGSVQGMQDAGAKFGEQFGGLNNMMEQIKNIPGIGNFGE